MNKTKQVGLGLLFAFGFAGCGDDDPGRDAAIVAGRDAPAQWDTSIPSVDGPATPLDAGVLAVEAGGAALDTGASSKDGGGVVIDAPVLSVDGGGVELDTATPSVDGGGVELDTGTVIPPLPYVWIEIQDLEQYVEPALCQTTGPGADIDAVARWGASGALGWGKVGSANFRMSPAGNTCENADCSGGNCKYAENGKTFQASALLAYTEGPADAKVNETADDSGYFSLNGGVLHLKMGDLNGAGPAWQFKSGDMLRVFEVDKTYITSVDASAQYACTPEHYQVYVHTDEDVSIKLRATTLASENAGICSPLAADSIEGCGTTVFVVP